ncbi:MAG: hypothetical protein ACXABF_11375 [Candidatus Thorarchaeota archaeon]|jgi:hypothetical protein
MADIRTTINKTIAGRVRLHFGTATILNGTTNGTIQTDLPNRVLSFVMDSCTDYAESAGVVTAEFADPTETRVCGWIALGY